MNERIKKIADNADMIINGYAFTTFEGGIKVLNVNRPKSAAVLNKNGKTIETNMDEIEMQIVEDYYTKNLEFMGV